MTPTDPIDVAVAAAHPRGCLVWPGRPCLDEAVDALIERILAHPHPHARQYAAAVSTLVRLRTLLHRDPDARRRRCDGRRGDPP